MLMKMLGKHAVKILYESEAKKICILFTFSIAGNSLDFVCNLDVYKCSGPHFI